MPRAPSPARRSRPAARERRARRRGLRELARAEILAELSALAPTIAVAGTHGKTTTAAMVVYALRGAGADPGWLIGGAPGGGLPNGHWGAGEWLVIEADESDRSMLGLEVEIAVLTSAELDHHTTFASEAEVREAFRSFLARARRAMVVRDQPELIALADPGAPAGDGSGHAGAPARGEAELVPYRAGEFTLTPGGSTFAWQGR